MERKHTRRSNRREFKGLVSIVCESERGDMQYQQARAQDISAEGLGVTMLNRLDPRSRVTVFQDRAGIRTSAVVRHCSRKGTKFLVGLEFTSSLKLA